MSEQTMLFVASIFKGTTLNKKMRLDHESHRHPEMRILKYHGYRNKKRRQSLLFYSQNMKEKIILVHQ
jgi:hypothetical protein